MFISMKKQDNIHIICQKCGKSVKRDFRYLTLYNLQNKELWKFKLKYCDFHVNEEINKFNNTFNQKLNVISDMNLNE